MLWTFLRSPIARYVGFFLIASLALWGFDRAGYRRGVADCEGRYALAAIQARDEAQKAVDAANARADSISRDLERTQRKLEGLKHEYLTYANAITGNCPASLGVLTSAASRGGELPKTPGESAGSSAPNGSAATTPARFIGANIATNYARFNECLARYNALLDWHEKAVK